MRSEVGRGSKTFRAPVALVTRRGRSHWRRHTRAWKVFAKLVGSVSFKLPLVPEPTSTVLARVLLESKMHTQVVLHSQAVRVSGVANIAMVLSDLVQIFVIGQTAGVTIGAATLIAGKRASPAAIVHLLGPCPSVWLLKTLRLAIIGHHLGRVLHFGVPHSHRLHLRRSPLITCSVVLIHASDALILTACFGSVLFVQTKMVDELLLDLEGFATLLTLVPTTQRKGKKHTKPEMVRGEPCHNIQYKMTTTIKAMQHTA